MPQDSPDAPRDPGQQELRRIRQLLWAIFLILAAAVIYAARDLLLPVLLAVLITLTLSPAVRGLARVGVPAPATAVGLMLALGLGLTLLIYFASGPVNSLAERAPMINAELRWKLADVASSLSAAQEAAEQMEELTEGKDKGGEKVVVSQSPGIFKRVMGTLAGTGSALMGALILATFLLGSGDFYHRRVIEAVPTLKDKKRALTILRDIELQISRYLGAITVINAVLGICIGVVLHVLGMPYAVIWGVAAFLLNFMPFLGAIIGVAVSAAVAFVTFPTAGQAVAVPLAYLVLTSVEGQFVTPYLVGRRLELNTVAVLLSVAAGLWVWGALGALIAVPYLLLAKVISDNIGPLNTFGTFLGSGAQPAIAEPGPA